MRRRRFSQTNKRWRVLLGAKRSEPQAFLIGGNKDPLNPVTSVGSTLRLNLFGAAIFELDFVHPNGRPEQGWYFQFGLTPGF